jgi:hypothetical protein
LCWVIHARWSDFAPPVTSHAGIAMDVEWISENEMKKWIGIMFAMTLFQISNIEEDWREEDDGLIPAHSFGIQSGLSKWRFKLIRHHFATVQSGVELRLLMLSDQFRPFSMTELLIASVQVSADHFARIVFPAVGARWSFSQQSVREDIITLHQGAGHDRVFVHAWNAPGRKNGKEPKKPSKVKIAKCL